MRTTGGEYDDGLDRIVAVEGDWERTYEFELCEDCQCWFGETADLSSGCDRSDHVQKGKIAFHNEDGLLVTVKGQQESNFDERMSIHFVQATIKDHCILDVGHAQVKNLPVKVSDSSASCLIRRCIKKSEWFDLVNAFASRVYM